MYVVTWDLYRAGLFHNILLQLQTFQIWSSFSCYFPSFLFFWWADGPSAGFGWTITDMQADALGFSGWGRVTGLSHVASSVSVSQRGVDDKVVVEVQQQQKQQYKIPGSLLMDDPLINMPPPLLPTAYPPLCFCNRSSERADIFQCE